MVRNERELKETGGKGGITEQKAKYKIHVSSQRLFFKFFNSSKLEKKVSL